MRLTHGRHLAYCTNVLRGEGWLEIFAALQTHWLAVKPLVCPTGQAFGIGLRLGDLASRQLAADRPARQAFRRWLDDNGCYVFTINGFPYGRFHGSRIKEQVYLPDWTTDARRQYTCRLFDLLAEWLPAGVAGSVSTVPGSYKGFAAAGRTEQDRQTAAMCRQLRLCGEHIARVSDRTGRALSLALEPEPLCWFENTEETVRFFRRLGPGLPVGLCFDTCHFAVEFESPRDALNALTAAGIPISKLHLSSALKIHPRPATAAALNSFVDAVYLHQVVVRAAAGGSLTRYGDLDEALAKHPLADPPDAGDEWRVHFHVPLHADPAGELETTSQELLGALDWLTEHPALCPHLEIETYTWDVLPPALRAARVEEQIAREYAWTLARLHERRLCDGELPIRHDLFAPIHG